MTAEDITAAAQRAVFQSLHRDVDVALLEEVLVRVGEIPYADDPETYVAVVVEVVRATLQPLIDRMRFECMATPTTIQ